MTPQKKKPNKYYVKILSVFVLPLMIILTGSLKKAQKILSDGAQQTPTADTPTPEAVAVALQPRSTTQKILSSLKPFLKSDPYVKALSPIGNAASMVMKAPIVVICRVLFDKTWSDASQRTSRVLHNLLDGRPPSAPPTAANRTPSEPNPARPVVATGLIAAAAAAAAATALTTAAAHGSGAAADAALPAAAPVTPARWSSGSSSAAAEASTATPGRRPSGLSGPT